MVISQFCHLFYMSTCRFTCQYYLEFYEEELPLALINLFISVWVHGFLSYSIDYNIIIIYFEAHIIPDLTSRRACSICSYVLWRVPIIFALSYHIASRYCESIWFLEFSLDWGSTGYTYTQGCSGRKLTNTTFIATAPYCCCAGFLMNIFSQSCLWKVCRVLHQLGFWIKHLEH